MFYRGVLQKCRENGRDFTPKYDILKKPPCILRHRGREDVNLIQTENHEQIGVFTHLWEIFYVFSYTTNILSSFITHWVLKLQNQKVCVFLVLMDHRTIS